MTGEPKKPIKASDVETTDKRPPEDVLRQRARDAVHRRAVRREALDRAGAEGMGTPGLIESIEARSQREAEERMAAFRRKQAARAAVQKQKAARKGGASE